MASPMDQGKRHFAAAAQALQNRTTQVKAAVACASVTQSASCQQARHQALHVAIHVRQTIGGKFPIKASMSWLIAPLV